MEQGYGQRNANPAAPGGHGATTAKGIAGRARKKENKTQTARYRITANNPTPCRDARDQAR